MKLFNLALSSSECRMTRKRLTCLVLVASAYIRLGDGRVFAHPLDPHASPQDSDSRRSYVDLWIPYKCTSSSPAPEDNLLEGSPNNPVSSRSSDGQQAASSTDEPAELAPKRIFGVIPNFRTSPTMKDYTPLRPKEKFKIASQDSFDRGTLVLGALFAGEAQLAKSTPSFGQGVGGYARYFAASYTDFVVGNYMTEAIYPSILHQDPRYFRRATGSAWSRLGWAMSQIFRTYTDSGGRQFNFSEIIGNSTTVAISNAYYPDNRNVSDALTKLGIQIGVDMAANILKEFSPELNRTFSRKHTGRKN